MATEIANRASAAQSVAAKNGVPAHQYEAFIRWAQEARPEEALALMERQDIAGIARLARQYRRMGAKEAAYSNEEILNARFGNGITAYQSDEDVMLRIPKHGEMSFKAAVRAGLITVR